MSTVVCRLISARLDAGLSMEEVAIASGLSVEYLSLIETGRTNPPVHTTTRLHDAIIEAAFERKATEQSARVPVPRSSSVPAPQG